uniref:Glucuronosyltransferase n=1 Tax=Rhabditophanes sp. KR3021 TaxID=114890 RepID=A0AC35UE02_9BILA
MKLLILLCAITLAYSYKIAVFTPLISSSQYIWNGRVSSKLAEAGHDVTLIGMKYFGKDVKRSKLHPDVKIYNVDGSTDFDCERAEVMHGNAMFEEISFFDERMKLMMNITVKQMVLACGNFLQNKQFLAWLSDQKFDLAVAHMYEYCPIGLIHHAKIPTWIWMNSGALMDYIAYDMGIPVPSSYVPPGMMEADTKMTLFERTKSFIGHTITPWVFHEYLFTSPETAIFRKYISEDFPDLRELGKKCPLVMVNTNEFVLDIPRPTLHKVVNIGGLGMSKKDAKPLEGVFKKVAEDPKVKGIVLLTFGSVANSTYIPMKWKSAFMDAFEQFPEYHFFFRYVGEDLKQNKPKNVDVTEWLPQQDLLQHPKAKIIITHAGYNSISEAIQASVPMILVPLFGDQLKNAVNVERNGLGVRIKKTEVTKEAIVNAITKILNDKQIKTRMQKVLKMIEKQPFSPEQKLVRYTEFLAEFKTLDNLVPYGTRLTFIEYHQIDVLSIILSTVLLILFVIYKLLKFIICLVTRLLISKLTKKTPKHKKE